MSAFPYLVGGFDAHKGLAEGHGPEAAVEEEEADVGVDVQEGGHVQVVGQRGRQAQDPDHALSGLYLHTHNQTQRQRERQGKGVRE